MVLRYKEYKKVNKNNNKEYIYRYPYVKCECGQEIGKYALKLHQTRWIHFFYLGKLENFKSEEKILS